MNDEQQIRKGTVINLDGRYFEFARRLPGNRYQFSEIEDGELRNLTHDGLARLISLGEAELDVTPQFQNADRVLTENELKAAERRVAYLRAFDEANIKCPTYPKYSSKSKKIIERVASEIDDPNPPSRKTVYNWIRLTQGKRALGDVAAAYLHEI